MKTTVLLPVINETFSLRQTVEIILQENPNEDFLFLVLTSPKFTTQESRAVIEELKFKYSSKIQVLDQKLPFLGGAMRDGFDAAVGDYTILMASDLETDPHAVKDLLKTIKSDPTTDIVTCSRWIGGATFEGYNPVKFILNKIFQLFFRILYRTKLTDMTFAYRIFKTEILKKIQWEELRHPLLFETIIKPLKLGYKVKEIPSSWKARTEGESQNTFMRNFVYFRIGLRVLFMSKNKILKHE